jgi:hypothetical protein
MKIAKWIAIVLLVYVAIVATFESLIGFFQPADQTTLVISVVDENGESGDRVLARLESDDQLYVAVNHWPRAWYKKALADPDVYVTLDGEKGAYLAIPVVAGGGEHERVDGDNRLPGFFRILTGFPPRYFLRLEPRPES